MLEQQPAARLEVLRRGCNVADIVQAVRPGGQRGRGFEAHIALL